VFLQTIIPFIHMGISLEVGQYFACHRLNLEFIAETSNQALLNTCEMH